MSYNLEQAFEFLRTHLTEWPTVIDDAPLCPGWGWRIIDNGQAEFYNDIESIGQQYYEWYCNGVDYDPD